MRFLKKLKMHKFLIFVLLLSSLAFAQDDQYVVDGALGAFGTKGYSVSQVKFAKLGLQEDLWYALKQRFNTGIWLDNRGDGQNNSGFAGYQLGFEVTNDVFQASIFSGPNLLTAKDSDLGGYFQFNETVFMGIVDKSEDSFGIAWNHFSSAGIEMPNRGKDFLGLQIKFPF